MKTLLFTLLIICASCSKDKPAENKNITVKAAVQDGMKTDGHLYWKPGIIFNQGIAATGTATVVWYFGGSYGNPYKTYTRTLNFTITPNTNSYFELSDDRKPDAVFSADSAKITSFNLTSGDYNVTIN